jgi:hypothetical protein
MAGKVLVFGLGLFAGVASAGPLGNVLGPLGGKPLAGTHGAGVQILPALPGVPTGLITAPRGVSPGGGSPVALPGLGSNDAPGPLGITVLQEGADGSGYDYVASSEQLNPLYALNPLTNDVVAGTVNTVTESLLGRQVITDNTLLDNDHLVDDGLDNNLVTPLLGLDGDGGFLDVALFDGNGTANAGDNGIGAAVGSGSFTGNGGAIGLGVANDGVSGNGGQIGIGVANQGPVSGNGGQIGIGVLSGEASGNGGTLGVGLLNENDTLHVCVAGNCGTFDDLATATGASPLIDSSGIVVGGGSDAATSGGSNPLLNAGVLTGDDVGNGGLIWLGVLAGSNSAKGQLLGACVLCGDDVANGGSLGVAALSGNNSGNGSYETGLLPVGVGVGVLSGNNSGNGGDVGIGALSGNGAGTGELAGIGALSGASSGNSDTIGVGAVNNGGGAGGGSTDGSGGGTGSGNGGLVGAGVISDSGSGGGNNGGGNNGGGNNGGNNGGGNSGGSSIAEAADEGFCVLEVRDGKGRVVQTVRRPCKQVTPRKARSLQS